jgi:vitamin B12 transporter
MQSFTWHCAIFVLALSALHAQTKINFTGVVRDPGGALVAQTRVRLLPLPAGASRETLTDAAGRFRFEATATGEYLLSISKANFGENTRVLTLQGEEELELTLPLSPLAQTVSVTTAAQPQPVDEIAKAFSSVGAEEVRQRNEYSLVEALRNTPGLLITNGGGPGQNTSIRLRGLRADATAVLIDGLPFRDVATAQADASTMLSTFNFVDLDRVEVLRGSGSSLYGTNAVGGVVNLISRQSAGPWTGEAQLEAGNLGMARSRFVAAGSALGQRLQMSLGAQHLNFRRGVDVNDANRGTALQGFLRYDISDRTTATARWWGSDDFVQLNLSPTTTGVPAVNIPNTSIVKAAPLSRDGVAQWLSGRTPSWTGVNLLPGRDDPDSRRASRFSSSAVTLRRQLSAAAQWQASWQHVLTRRVFRDGPGGLGSQPATSNYSLFDGQMHSLDTRVTLRPLSIWDVTAGAVWEREHYEQEQNNFLPAPRTLSTVTSIRQRNQTAFFAAQLALAQRRLLLSASGRYQNFSLSPPRFVTTGVANAYARSGKEAPPAAWTGDVSAAWFQPRSNSYRAPGLFERYGGGFSVNQVSGLITFSPWGDPRLASDRYNAFDAGVDQYLFANRLRVSTTFFYVRIVSQSLFDSSGAIRAGTDPYGRSSGYLNGSGGISRGVEMAAEYRPSNGWLLQTSWTYTNAGLDRDVPVAGFFRALGVPRQMASASLLRHWSSRLQTTFEVFRSGVHYTSLFAAGRSRAFAFDGYTKADVSANFRVWGNDAHAASLYGRVDNLLNQRWYQNGWLAPGVAFVSGLRYAW